MCSRGYLYLLSVLLRLVVLSMMSVGVEWGWAVMESVEGVRWEGDYVDICACDACCVKLSDCVVVLFSLCLSVTLLLLFLSLLPLFLLFFFFLFVFLLLNSLSQ